jgi:hypothetical protein
VVFDRSPITYARGSGVRFQEDGCKADAVGFGAIGMLADVADLEAHVPLVEARQERFAIARCRGRMTRRRADVEHQLDTRFRSWG